MSDDNAMDVDNAPKTPPPCIFRDISHQSPMCSSTSSSPSLPQALLDEFKDEMIEEASAAKEWSERLINAGSVEDLLQTVLFQVLSSLGRVVMRTALQKYIIDEVINFNGRSKPLRLSSVKDRSCVRNEKLVRAFVTKIFR